MTLNLFYSYSHKDEKFRERLETHLSILRKNGLISEWHDRRITAGSEWENDIDLSLGNADIILLLISSNFLESDYCYDTETIRALEMHEANEAVVIPIILRPCLWLQSKLKKLQALPRDNKPISTWSNEDEAWVHVSEEILKKIDEIKKSKRTKIKESNKAKEPSPIENIELFLKKFSNWYFSPLRIQKWGALQQGFSNLNELTTKEIKDVLEELVKKKEAKTTISQKGNTIYKIII